GPCGLAARAARGGGSPPPPPGGGCPRRRRGRDGVPAGPCPQGGGRAREPTPDGESSPPTPARPPPPRPGPPRAPPTSTAVLSSAVSLHPARQPYRARRPVQGWRLPTTSGRVTRALQHPPRLIPAAGRLWREPGAPAWQAAPDHHVRSGADTTRSRCLPRRRRRRRVTARLLLCAVGRRRRHRTCRRRHPPTCTAALLRRNPPLRDTAR